MAEFWLLLVVALVLGHFVGDFVLQTHWQASNKSKNNDALTRHVLTYTVAIAVVSYLFFRFVPLWVGFVAANGVVHWCVDWCTSRVSSRLFMEQFVAADFPKAAALVMRNDFNPHNFFVVLGFDQLLHMLTLVFTTWIFLT